MTQYYTDFSELPADVTPPEWSERWVIGGQTLVVVRDPAATGGAVLRHEITVDSRRAWSWDVVPGASDVEVLARVRADDEDARMGVVARGDGMGTKRGGECGWTSELDNAGSRFRTCSYDPSRSPRPHRPHGIGNILGDSEVNWAAGEWQWIRLRVETANGWVRAYGRTWNDGDAEPEGWQHADEKSDPDHLGRLGWVGITGQTTNGRRDFDIFGVGTDGDPAPASSIA